MSDRPFNRGFFFGVVLGALFNTGWVLLRWHDPVNTLTWCVDTCGPSRPALATDHAAAITFAVFRTLMSGYAFFFTERIVKA